MEELTLAGWVTLTAIVVTLIIIALRLKFVKGTSSKGRK